MPVSRSAIANAASAAAWACTHARSGTQQLPPHTPPARALKNARKVSFAVRESVMCACARAAMRQRHAPTPTPHLYPRVPPPFPIHTHAHTHTRGCVRGPLERRLRGGRRGTSRGWRARPHRPHAPVLRTRGVLLARRATPRRLVTHALHVRAHLRAALRLRGPHGRATRGLAGGPRRRVGHDDRAGCLVAWISIIEFCSDKTGKADVPPPRGDSLANREPHVSVPRGLFLARPARAA